VWPVGEYSKESLDPIGGDLLIGEAEIVEDEK
jgi:hypothetical protein